MRWRSLARLAPPTLPVTTHHHALVPACGPHRRALSTCVDQEGRAAGSDARGGGVARRRRVAAYDLGTVPYATAWQWQLNHHKACGAGAGGGGNTWQDVVYLLQHHPVFTLGRGASPRHVLFPMAAAGTSGLPEVARVDRGGEVTYHGPGQLVVYPLLDLHHFRKDLRWYVSSIEDVLIGALAAFGLHGTRLKGFPGVWVGGAKVAAVGMGVTRWRTKHGFSLNVNPDMRQYDNIVACGIEDREVTSLATLLGSDAPALPVVQREVCRQMELAWDVSLAINHVAAPPHSSGL